MINGHRPHLLITAGLISYLSMVYPFAKPLELLIHRLGSPKCVYMSRGYLGALVFLPLKEIAW